MDYIDKRVLQTIDHYGMIPDNGTVIAAVSGGYDSLFMLRTLCNLRRLRRFNVIAAHVNHGLRNTAQNDADYVAKICEKLGVTLHCTHLDVAAHAKLHKLSVETAGRELRYDFFRQVADKFPADLVRIATAHNANDNAETIVMHLLRGCGSEGLRGIPPVNNNIIRPIIGITRDEIESAIDKTDLTPCHDETNSDTNYHRNDIRLNIMPQLLQRCGVNTFNNLAEIMRAEDDYLNSKTDNILRKFPGGVINRKYFVTLPLAMKRRVLRSLIDNDNLSLIHIDAIIEMCDKGYGNKHIELPHGYKAILKQGQLTIDK